MTISLEGFVPNHEILCNACDTYTGGFVAKVYVTIGMSIDIGNIDDEFIICQACLLRVALGGKVGDR
jgi:hypothetical protein